MDSSKVILTDLNLYKINSHECQRMLYMAREQRVYGVLVSPAFLPCAAGLRTPGQKLFVSVGYPSGATLPEFKAAEMAEAQQYHPDGFYLTLSQGSFASGDTARTEAELAALEEAASGRETGLITEISALSGEQVARLLELCGKYHVRHFVATSGFVQNGVPYPSEAQLAALAERRAPGVELEAFSRDHNEQTLLRLGLERILMNP